MPDPQPGLTGGRVLAHRARGEGMIGKPGLLSIFLLIVATGPNFAQPAPRSDAEIQQAVDSLLKKMTTEEKIGQLSQLFVFDAGESVEKSVAAGEVGSLLFITDPAVINRLQHLAVEKSRLHVPLIFGYDVIHGFRTIFPVPIAMAASWDPSLEMQGQATAAQEARAVGISWAFAPMLDIARDPRWGRMVEGAGEDPYLGSAMAAAQVRGFQGEYIGAPDHVLACMKHFAGYGAAEGGRDYDGSFISDAQMENVYLAPFHAAVKAGVGSAMSAYMDLNDVPATGNRWLLSDVLRQQWGFKGLVVSDADAVKSLVNHGYARDLHDAAVRALNAGVDMEMAQDATAFGQSLAAALKAGEISLQQIETADRRILTAKIRMGLFEHPYADQAQVASVLGSPEHRTQERMAAERSAVLLRNENGLLPLKKEGYKKIAVVGPLADAKLDTLGPWAFQQDLYETVTVLEGLKSEVGSSAQISFAPGVQIARTFPSFFDKIDHSTHPPAWSAEQQDQEMQRAVDLAGASDLTILVLGELHDMSGEAASRQSLDLPGREQELMEKVVAAGRPVVLVLVNGRPLNITWASKHVPAILESWYPGTQGGNAVARLLFGDVVPGGKLPFSWPRNVGQIPINYAHNTTQAPEDQGKRYWDVESTPLYPFGFGLSYSRFTFSDLRLSKTTINPDESLDVTVVVQNIGSLTADEVAQVYLHQRYGSSSRPVRELKGFERTEVKPAERKTLRFKIGKDERTYWSAASRSWVVDASTFDVWVGPDSSASLHASFDVTR
jgi:beta-glucosidase